LPEQKRALLNVSPCTTREERVDSVEVWLHLHTDQGVKPRRVVSPGFHRQLIKPLHCQQVGQTVSVLAAPRDG
jgi:hypothetical protein